MAEMSYLWDNPGTGDSPGGGYSQTEFMNEMFRMILNGTGNLGVLYGWLNELEVTDGGGLNAAVNTGGAVVYGFAYENDAALNVAIGNNTTEWVVVRASWAAQTARLVAIAPGAFTQTAGVTYDIPLAQVTTVAGVITLITDTREFCEFTTDLIDNVVETEHIPADAITTAKLENQIRWVLRGEGQLEPDVTNPVGWITGSPPYWAFENGQTDTGWVTLRVPADFTGATTEVFFWNTLTAVASTGDVVWAWSSWDAQPGAVLANQSNSVVVPQAGRVQANGAYRDSIGTIAVTAGDIVHVEVYRDGTNILDTEVQPVALHLVEFAYTADS